MKNMKAVSNTSSSWTLVSAMAASLTACLLLFRLSNTTVLSVTGLSQSTDMRLDHSPCLLAPLAHPVHGLLTPLVVECAGRGGHRVYYLGIHIPVLDLHSIGTSLEFHVFHVFLKYNDPCVTAH